MLKPFVCVQRSSEEALGTIQMPANICKLCDVYMNGIALIGVVLLKFEGFLFSCHG